MIENILVKNSKLILKKLSFETGDSQIYIGEEEKKNLRYQELYFMDLDKESIKVKSLYGESGNIKLDPLYSSFHYAWCIIKGTKKYIGEGEDYTEDEQKIFRFILSGLIKSGHIQVSEVLIQGLGDKRIQKGFYESYGDNLKEFARELLHKGPEEKKEEIVLERYSPIYQRTRRYSVYDLINDLVHDKSEILTDSELCGKYLKVSRGIKTDDKFKYEKWSKVIGRQGNKSRANMSITFLGKISIKIPENEYGIEPGIREFPGFRSFCIIKDGVLWTPKIAAKIKSGALVGKLKHIGVIEGTVLYKNEYILNLTKLPIVNRDFIGSLTTSSILYPELQSRLYRIGLAYIKHKMKGTAKIGIEDLMKEEETVSKKEEFLRSLGIYDNEYYPPKSSVKDLDHSYESICIERKILGLPDNYFGNVADYLNKKKCKNKVICKFLDELENDKTKKGLTYEELKELYMKELKKTDSLIVDNNFRLILGKTLKLKEKSNPTIRTGLTKVLVTHGESVKGKFKVSLKRILV